jgi:type IV secretion system protein VirB1
MSALSLALIAQLAATPACTVPGMVPDFWQAVVHRESNYDPLALHDDTASRSYYPDTADAAEALATKLMAQGHSVGVGLSQLTASDPAAFQTKFGINLRDALDACRNMATGARFYVSRSLAIYNAGSPSSAKGIGYASRVMSSVGARTTTAQAQIVPLAVNRHASDTEAW